MPKQSEAEKEQANEKMMWNRTAERWAHRDNTLSNNNFSLQI